MEDRVYSSIAELVGHTPLVELTNFEKEHGLKAQILVKPEYFNPSGSVKDRIALAMIQSAEKTGKIRKGDTILDFSSGNTGIALAAYANALGYHYVCVIQPGVSSERTLILKAYGVELLQFNDIPGVPELIASEGLVFSKFYELLQSYSDAHGYFFVNQGLSPENVLAHYHTTGPEIWRATGGRVDYAVMLVGTSGTLVGTGRYLREMNPNIKIVGAQPANESLKNPNHPEVNTIDGVLQFHHVPEERIPYFIRNYSFKCDEYLDLNADEAYETGRELVKSDGIFLGQSSAAAVLGALKIAQRPEAAEKTIVAICADNAFKYLSTNLYR